MTAQILNSELSNLIQESKRKHTALRSAAEKSLDELKSLRVTSEAQIAADLSQRPHFITPFLIACETKSSKFTGIAIVCLQRLVVSRGLPRSRLKEVLEAFREASTAGTDVQLKILQALPALLQNYSEQIKEELLGSALHICSILQTSKNGIVNNTAAATLQQLVVSVFDKVAAEDAKALEVPTVGEVPSEDGPIQVRAAALDAYKVFNDVCLLTESEKPKFLSLAAMPQTFCLELIESVLTNHADLFLTHPEQSNILRVRVMPFVVSALSEKMNFAATVRIVRVLYTILRRHLSVLVDEGGMALGLLTHMLDQDTSLWKRALCMEVFRGLFAEPALIRRIYALYDGNEGKKSIVRDLVANFVRISTEKPQVIGLGPQSTVPSGSQNGGSSASTDQAMLEASGVPGIVSSNVGSNEPSVGISTQWSTMRVPCIDQLDKADPPAIPESYIYSLTLACINSFSEGLAKFILPLTVPADSKNRKKLARSSESTQADEESEAIEDSKKNEPRMALERRLSSKRRSPVPINPLTLQDHPLFEEIKTCAAIIDDCWPAILATCSTFLYAALDSDYYHGLVRAFQKFTHVAGLLRLATPRDAFLTTLGKAAVPPNVFSASLSSSVPRPTTPSTPSAESHSIFSNAKGLLSVDSLVGNNSPTTDRRSSVNESGPLSLNTRNLLCLRALLNLGIALGPTLETAWLIILETLQQADYILFSTARTASKATGPSSQRSDQGADPAILLANFGTEIKAVEVAASRLFESTADFPNPAFVDVVRALCKLFGRDDAGHQERPTSSEGPSSSKPRKPSQTHRRFQSVHTVTASQNQEDHFALAKLAELASINIERLMAYEPEVSGWEVLTADLVSTATSTSINSPVRLRAAEIMVRIVLEAANSTITLPDEAHSIVQRRLLGALYQTIEPFQQDSRETRETLVAVQATDVDVHRIVLEGLKNLLEHSGETLINGWDIAFDIITSVFQNESHANGAKGGRRSPTSRSARLVRSSFNSLQLICSDFLSSLPHSCFLVLVNTLYDFCSQDDDINICLTTVTYFWVLSDFISKQPGTFSLGEDTLGGADEDALIKKTSGDDVVTAKAALWLLLLLRLTAVSSDERQELRNSAIQTLLRIFDTYGDQLSPQAWSMCLQQIIFKLLSSIEAQLDMNKDSSSSSRKEDPGWIDTTVVVLHGIAGLLSTYLSNLASHTTFKESWRHLLDHFASLLKYGVLEVNTAVFKALQQILVQANAQKKSNPFLDRSSINLAWDLWSQAIPLPEEERSDAKCNNQDCLLAYVAALQQVYHLIENNIEVPTVERILSLLRDTVQKASAPAYSADIEYLTPLQSIVLEAIRMLRTDLPGIPAVVISQVAEFVSLPFTTPQETTKDNRRPTYVALSKSSMILLESLIVPHASDQDIYSSGALSSSLTALSKPIVAKYSFPIITKSISPWRQATTTALAVLRSTMPLITQSPVSETTLHSIWTSIVTICNGITAADCTTAPPSTPILADQDFDITSFLTLRSLIIPALGAPSISDRTRRAYTESLFQKSLIHAPSPSELPQPGHDLLTFLSTPRPGRTSSPPPTLRYKMSYTCLSELLSLVRYSTSSPEQIKLAQAAAPYLILRAGISLRAYIADQPLRGRMPQPVSQRRELLFLLKELVGLRCEPEAIPECQGVESEGKKHLLRLYPLLSGAVRAARGDQEVLEWVGRALDEVGMEFGV